MSNDVSSFYVGIFVGIIFVIALNMITPVTDAVSAQAMTKAVEVCEPHNGLVRVYRPSYFDGSFEVLCKNQNVVVIPKMVVTNVYQ